MTRTELIEKQNWSLDQKIYHSLEVIDTFYQKLDGKVYVSFSGGKDSTVLYWLSRKIYPDIKAVFCNTGNEYPDIVRFVRQMIDDGMNVEIIQPKMSPKEVLNRYGFPLVSKETSGIIQDIRRNPNCVRAKRALGEIKTSYKGTFSHKWNFLINEEFDTSNYCCEKLKKEPFRKYEKQHGVAPILGVMADESRQRTTDYINGGGV